MTFEHDEAGGLLGPDRVLCLALVEARVAWFGPVDCQTTSSVPQHALLVARPRGQLLTVLEPSYRRLWVSLNSTLHHQFIIYALVVVYLENIKATIFSNSQLIQRFHKKIPTSIRKQVLTIQFCTISYNLLR